MMFQLVVFVNTRNGTFRITSDTPFTADVIKGVARSLLHCGNVQEARNIDETYEVTLTLGEDALATLHAAEEELRR